MDLSVQPIVEHENVGSVSLNVVLESNIRPHEADVASNDSCQIKNNYPVN